MTTSDLIARAREIAPALRAAGSSDRDRLAGWLLDELAVRAERLEAIRDIIAGFDWDRDDRQYALEQIEMIADDGTSSGNEACTSSAS